MQRAGWICWLQRMQGDDCTAHRGQWWAGTEHKAQKGIRKAEVEEVEAKRVDRRKMSKTGGTRKRGSSCENVAGYVKLAVAALALARLP